MNKLKEIKRLRELAEKYALEDREILGKHPMNKLAQIYNGIGPDAFPEWLRGFVTALHPSLAVVPSSTTSSGTSPTARTRRSRRPTTASSATATRWPRPSSDGGTHVATP